MDSSFATIRRGVALVIAASLFALTGCDPTIRSTVEDGVINVSTSLVTSVFQALAQVFSNVYGTG